MRDMDVLAQLLSRGLSEEERRYLDYHRPRLERDVQIVRDLTRSRAGRPARVLDVGPHFLTLALRECTDCIVDQIGFRYDVITKPRSGESHHELDLNRLSDRAAWPKLGPYDIVIAAEVIEHLHISPSFLLGFLHECLVPGGHLILQTPNGVSLKRRVPMLLGRNPFDLIREEPGNPGHFREYTRQEMTSYARAAGFEVVAFDGGVYFDYGRRGLPGKLYGLATRLLPQSFRDGMTFLLRGPASAEALRLCETSGSRGNCLEHPPAGLLLYPSQ